MRIYVRFCKETHYNERQAEALASLPEEKREWMARLFRIGNATYCYYNRAKDLTVFDAGDQPAELAGDLLEWLEHQLSLKSESRSVRELLAVYFEEYLAGLAHDRLRRAEQAAGLDKAKTSYPFRRYVLERHDIGMDEYLRQHLSGEDYAYHVECGRDDGSRPIKDNRVQIQIGLTTANS